MGNMGFVLLSGDLRSVSNTLRGLVVNQAADGDELADKQWGKIMTKAKLVRRPNGELRTREYLTGAEVEKLIAAAKRNRWGHRDATMILLCFRHGLRASEIVDLRWEQVDLGRNAALHVRRVKQGLPSVHPLQGDEMRALRSLKRDVKSPFVFVSERNAPFTTAGFAKLIERAGSPQGSALRRIRTCCVMPAVTP